MVTAGVIAGVGVLTASSILIVGAMAVSPDLLPMSAAAIGLADRRWNLAGRAWLTLTVGLLISAVAAMVDDLVAPGDRPDRRRRRPGSLDARTLADERRSWQRARCHRRRRGRDARLRERRWRRRRCGDLGDDDPGRRLRRYGPRTRREATTSAGRSPSSPSTSTPSSLAGAATVWTTRYAARPLAGELAAGRECLDCAQQAGDVGGLDVGDDAGPHDATGAGESELVDGLDGVRVTGPRGDAVARRAAATASGAGRRP